MRLEAERRPTIEAVTPARLRTAIGRLRSHGPCSTLSLTAADGSFLQVAGGPATCMMERKDAASGRHFRAFQAKSSEVFADGTLLCFSGGTIPLLADEWFLATDAEETFLAYLRGQALPERVQWRDITAMLRDESPPP